VDVRRWPLPALFRHLQSGGRVPPAEMFRAFNMGVGMILVVPAARAAAVAARTRGRLIGRIERGPRGVALQP
jgi:phosphoribosylformylglycinamidine cyclo-ligase